MNQLILNEKDNVVFVASIQEDAESNRPDFDYNSNLGKIKEVINDIKKLKHQINVYNTTTTLVDYDMTIDEALMILPILNVEKERLYKYSTMQKKKRVADIRYTSSIIDYQYVNFDIEFAKHEYESVVEKINAIQFSLDKTNNTLLLEF